jgi:hypothetical protein
MSAMPKTAQERIVAPAAAKGAVAPRVVVQPAALPTPSSYMSSRSLDVIPLVIPRSRMGACCHMRPMDPWPHAVVQIGTSPITSERDGQMVSEAQSGFRTRKCVFSVARVEMSGHESEACQRGPRPNPRSRLDPTRPPPGAARVRCHWRVLLTYDPTGRPGPPRAPAATRALGLVSREIRFDLLNYALGSPCQPATTSPATHRAHDRASPSSPVATCGWPRYTPPRTRYTYMHVAGVTRQNSIAEQSTP